jgi:hypothetical protein
MDEQQQPDEKIFDAREESNREDQGGSVDEVPGSSELVPQGNTMVLRPEPNAILHLLSSDPVSLRIVLGGGVAIAVILASRVKQLANVEFFEGMPNGLADFLRASKELPPS